MSTDLSTVAAGSLVDAEVFKDKDVARLAGVEFYKCRFDNCRFVEAVVKGVVFEDCEFVGCDLTRVLLGGSSLRGVRFVDCKLLGVDFSKANDNPELSFERCGLRYAVFDGVNLGGARFVDCQAQEASFVESDLREADFQGSDLTRTALRRCRMAGCDFTTATGVLFDPDDNTAKGALISVETAIHLAQEAGLLVAGHDDKPGKKPRGRR